MNAPWLSFLEFGVWMLVGCSAEVQSSCPVFENENFSPNCNFELSPTEGPEVGGTLVRLENVAYEDCPIIYNAGGIDDVYCRFMSDAFTQIVRGRRIDKTKVNCLSPFSGQQTGVTVSFSVVPEDCPFDQDSIVWFTANEEFNYYGERAGVILAAYLEDGEYEEVVPIYDEVAEFDSRSLQQSEVTKSPTTSSPTLSTSTSTPTMNPTSGGCCSHDFKHCVPEICGTTEAECQNCQIGGLFWITKPGEDCVARYESCGDKVCCNGLICEDGIIQKKCFHFSEISSSPSLRATSSPTFSRTTSSPSVNQPTIGRTPTLFPTWSLTRTDSPTISPMVFPTSPTDSPTLNIGPTPTLSPTTTHSPTPSAPSATPISTRTGNTPIMFPSSKPSLSQEPTLSNFPSMAPSISAAPSVLCENDKGYRYNGRWDTDCTWVGETTNRRQRRCAETEVHKACPVTCGLCCADDKDFRFDAEGQSQGCAWIAEQEERIDTYCYGDRKYSCAETCGLCQTYISVAPSVTPPIPIVAPTKLIVAGTPTLVEWSSDALLLSVSDENLENLMVKMEVLAYDDKAHSTDTAAFQVIQTFAISSVHTNSTILMVDDDAISNFLISEWGIEEVSVAIILVRLSIHEKGDVDWIKAARSSKLIGVLPGSTSLQHPDDKNWKCPIVHKEKSCNLNITKLRTEAACPGSIRVAEQDFRFDPDGICSWPSGNLTCEPDIDLTADFVTTCLSSDAQDNLDDGYSAKCKVNVTEFNEKVQLIDDCSCETFHKDAKGCLRFESSQCCYNDVGALMTDVEAGGGTAQCYHTEKTLLDTIGNFLFDILPYSYCCLLNNDCDTYNDLLQDINISYKYYKNEKAAAHAFGDPHLTTFDDLNYDFNGYGEYIAYCTYLDVNVGIEDLLKYCNPAEIKHVPNRNILSVNFRFAPYKKDQQGTVTVGVAIEDPRFRNGEHSLVVQVNPNPNIRLDLFNGDNLVSFPSSYTRRVKKNIDGALIIRTANTEREVMVMTIVLPSGAKVRIRETHGVLSPAITRPVYLQNSIGLLGLPDDLQANDFTNSSGGVLELPINKLRNKLEEKGEMKAFEPEEVQEIFESFGQSWMIRSASASLFNANFSKYFREDYEPWFQYDLSTESPTTKSSTAPSDKPSALPSFITPHSPSLPPTNIPSQTFSAQILSVLLSKNSNESKMTSFGTSSDDVQRLTNKVEKLCGKFEDRFIQQACIFDFAVTRDEKLVEAMTAVVVRDKETETISRNTAPVIRGNMNKKAIVRIGESATFRIKADDAENDKITATLKQNDGELFELFTRPLEEGSEGVFDLIFIGIEEVGKFKAKVIVTDGLTPVEVTATVTIPIPEYPSTEPSLRPTTLRPTTSSPSSTLLPSAMASHTPSSFPKGEPSSLPTKSSEPSSLPTSEPSSLPTKSSEPSSFPTTTISSLPTIEPSSHSRSQCADGDDEFYQQSVSTKCSWLNSPQRKATWCTKLFVANKCPRSCGKCCGDDTNFMFINKYGDLKNCEWIKSSGSIEDYCTTEWIKKRCPFSCEDRNFMFKNNFGNMKNCEWIRNTGSINDYCTKAWINKKCTFSCEDCTDYTSTP